jgi:hypothetical protein
MGSKAQGTGVSESPARTILNSWKEVASYIGRGVRTVQRYENDQNLPVHRIADREHSSVIAYSDELDHWLSRRPIKDRPYVRPTLVVIDAPKIGHISSRKLVLEAGLFNVLTAYTLEEAYSTAEKFDVDGFIIDYIPGDESSLEACESLKERSPAKPIFGVMPLRMKNGNSHAFNGVDYLVSDSSPQDLLTVVLQVFGSPRLT